MTRKKQTLLIGAHMSISGGLEKAIKQGDSINCSVIQLFTKNNRQWHAKKLSADEIALFKKAAQESPIKCIVAHASYLINIGSPKNDVAAKSATALRRELERCQELDIPYLVLHPGSHLGHDEQEALERIAHNLDAALEAAPGHTSILLETMAGQGSSVGHTFKQIATIIELSRHKKRLGVCLDTCHVFAAGYDMSTKPNYEKMWQEFDGTIGINKLKVIHVNDSKKEVGSHVDRHEHIGKGKIGINGFKLLFNDERFFDIPKILETPKATLADDEKNIKTLISLLSTETKKYLEIFE